MDRYTLIFINTKQQKKEVVIPKRIKYKIWFIAILAMQILGVLAATIWKQPIVDFFADFYNCKYLYKIAEWFFGTPDKFKIFSQGLLALAFGVKAKLQISKPKEKEEKEYNKNLDKWYGLVTTILIAAAVLPYNLYAGLQLIWYLYYKNMEYNKKSA